MDVEHLAQQLLDLANRHDRRLALVVRAGPDHDVYFRFCRRGTDQEDEMCWEARPNACGSAEAPCGQAEWLTRMDFRRDGDGPAARVVRTPVTLEDARVIAGLVSFLLQQAYDLPADAEVSAALETA
jgi:hypothetical protein